MDEIERNDPEVIRKGVHDCHLGHTFSEKLVFASFDSRYYRSIINLKKLWWILKTPYQKFTHRNCIHCKEWKN